MAAMAEAEVAVAAGAVGRRAGGRGRGGRGRGGRGRGRPRDAAVDAADADRLADELARVALVDAPVVPGARAMNLFCVHCGEPQEWDVDGDRARPLPDDTAPDGIRRTRAGRVLYDARNSTCYHCGNKVLCHPLSAVCTHCNCMLEGFRPTYWKCSNNDGTGRRRKVTKAGKRGGEAAQEPAAGDGAYGGAGGGGGGGGGGCAYARTCNACENYDRRYRGKPPCDCACLHSANTGAMGGNGKGNYGWVLVH